MKFETIKNKIKNGEQYFLYNVSVEKPYLVAKGQTKTEVKQIFKEKINKSPNKYRDTNHVLMYFQFRKPDNKFTFGDLLVKLHNYYLNDKFQIKSDSDYFGYVYFEKEFLEEKGFSYSYLRNIIYLFKLDKIQFNPLGQPGYEELEGRIRHALKYYEKLKK